MQGVIFQEKTTVFRDVTSFTLVDRWHRFRGTCFSTFRIATWTIKVEAADSAETSVRVQRIVRRRSPFTAVWHIGWNYCAVHTSVSSTTPPFCFSPPRYIVYFSPVVYPVCSHECCGVRTWQFWLVTSALGWLVQTIGGWRGIKL